MSLSASCSLLSPTKLGCSFADETIQHTHASGDIKCTVKK